MEYFPMDDIASVENGDVFAKREWLEVWDRVDTSSDGRVKLSQVENFILNTNYADSLTPEQITNLLKEADTNKDGFISKEEFLHLVRSARRSPFAARLVRSAALLSVPRRGRNVHLRKYLDEYSCSPPPLFTLSVTLAEISVFLFYGVKMSEAISPTGPTPFDSPLIYDPARRYEAWRFLSYVLIHCGWVHILTNCVMQLVVGIILELVHDWWRVLTVYCLGTLAGSLAASVTAPDFYLAGASGAVYALEYAYLGNLIINWSEMSFPAVQATALAAISVLDVSFAVWDSHFNPNPSNTSYMCHLGGALVGLLVGVNVLRNLKEERGEKYCRWISFFTALILFVIAISVHVFASDYFPPSDHS